MLDRRICEHAVLVSFKQMLLQFRGLLYKHQLAVGAHVFLSRCTEKRLDQKSGIPTQNDHLRSSGVFVSYSTTGTCDLAI